MLRQRGVTLIELVIFIMLVSIAFAALLLAFNQFGLHSTDPLLCKQALAVAESLLDEVELMPFTFCDPDDVNASTASSAVDCTGGVNGSEDKLPLTFEAGESRYSTSTPFDNVSDYNGFALPTPPGILDISGTAITGLAGYSASIAVAQFALGGIGLSEALHITVTVTPPSGPAVVLDGYRTRYAPNTAP